MRHVAHEKMSDVDSRLAANLASALLLAACSTSSRSTSGVPTEPASQVSEPATPREDGSGPPWA